MTNPPPAKQPREFWIVGPDNDEPSVHHINPGFNDQVHVIEYSAYSQLAEQLERYKGMWESECARGNRHLDKLMLAERALEQARKERDEAIRQADALANMIESLFCNPEGRASFEGSQGDKDIFNQGFEKFKAWREGEG